MIHMSLSFLFFTLLWYFSFSPIYAKTNTIRTLRGLPISGTHFKVNIQELPPTHEDEGYKTILISSKLKKIKYKINLRVNKNLFTKSYTFLNEKFEENSSILENCYYHGKVKGYPRSFVAISQCDGYFGMIILKGYKTQFSLHTLPSQEYILQEEFDYTFQKGGFVSSPNFNPSVLNNDLYSSTFSTSDSVEQASSSFLKGKDLSSKKQQHQTFSDKHKNDASNNWRNLEKQRYSAKFQPYPSSSSSSSSHTSDHLDATQAQQHTKPFSAGCTDCLIQKPKSQTHQSYPFSRKKIQTRLMKRSVSKKKKGLRKFKGYYRLFVALNGVEDLDQPKFGEHLIGDYINLAQYYYQHHSFNGYQIQLAGAHVIDKSSTIPLIKEFDDAKLFLTQWHKYGTDHKLLKNSDIGYVITNDKQKMIPDEYGRKLKYIRGLGISNNIDCFKYFAFSFGIVNQLKPHNLYDHVITLVHELGHNTCMRHAKDDNCPQDDKTIMSISPEEIGPWIPFSACSLKKVVCIPGSYQ